MLRFFGNINTRIESILHLVDWSLLQKQTSKQIMQVGIENEMLILHSVYMGAVVGILNIVYLFFPSIIVTPVWSWTVKFRKKVIQRSCSPYRNKNYWHRKKNVLETNTLLEERIICEEHVNTSCKTSRADFYIYIYIFAGFSLTDCSLWTVQKFSAEVPPSKKMLSCWI